MDEQVKICTSCSQAKPLACFHLKGLDKYGAKRLQSICKDCANDKRVKRYKKSRLKKRTPGRFELSSCAIFIIHPSYADSSETIKVMTDYIEAVYAVLRTTPGK